MEIRTGTRPPRWRPLLLYGPLFLIPAVGVFVIVLMHFQGLPPQYESTIVFRLDPHFGALAATRDDAPDSPRMLDPQAVTREIKSRYRMREAMKDLEIFKDRSEDKQDLILDQTIQALSVNIKREFGENAYLVTVKLTRATHDPAPYETLLENIRNVYLHYNVDRLIDQQAKDKGTLDRSLADYKHDYDDAIEQLNAFRHSDDNRQFIPESTGDPPPIAKELLRIRKELADIEDKRDAEAASDAKALREQLRKLNEFKKNAPAVMRQYNILKETASEYQQRLKKVRSQHKVCDEALVALRSQRDQRFTIVHAEGKPKVLSRTVESEQTSRLFIGAATGVVAGLLVLLFALVIGILARRSE